MDPTEDLSARVLLRHILTTETPRTPITRSDSRSQSGSGTRRSSRLANKDAGAQTPQDILRRSLRHKMRESINRKSLHATRRRTASVVLKKTNTPAQASVLFDDGDTPRHILMNILRTEPVRSPVVHEKVASEAPQPSSDNSSITCKRPSIELSGLDLPDVTIANVASTAKGLSRKRQRRSLNVTAFEKRLNDGEDVEDENEESIGGHSSLSLSGSTSLSLKTPFLDVRTEKRGLQRRVSNRRKITVEEFGAAVNKRQVEGASSFELAERGLSETAYSEGFTLGLSKLSEPDITTDIVHCNTALYAQADTMTSNFSIVATQDKATVMASQLQRQIREMEQQEEAMETSQSQLGKEKSVNVFPDEGGIVAEPHSFSQSEEEEGAAESQTSVREDGVETQTEEAAADSQTEEEEEEAAADSQTEEEAAADSQTEEEAAADSQTEEEEEAAADSQTEEEAAADSQTEEEEEAAADSQTEEEESAADSQTEDGGAYSQAEEDVAVRSQSEEEQEEQEEDAPDSQTEEEGAAASQCEENQTSEEEGGPADSQHEDGYDDGQASEHISRRAHRSEGGLIMPAGEAGWSGRKSKTHSAVALHSSLEMGSHTGIPDSAEPDADKENSFRLPELTRDIEDGGHLSDNSPEQADAQDPAEQEEEEEEDLDDGEESEEIPSKTPAFVREKRKIFLPDPLASPSSLKNIQASSASDGLPAPKPKQVRKRRSGPAKSEPGLPKSYIMGVFKHFAKTKVSADVYPVLKETMDKFFERMAEDLETYAVHAKRKTIDFEDTELLLRRQGYVNDKAPVEVLIEKYLRMDQRKLLIPIATSGNVVVPKKRR